MLSTLKKRSELERILGEPSTKLLHWARVGAIVDEGPGGGGRGKAMLFDPLKVAMVKLLIEEYDLSLMSIESIWRAYAEGVRKEEEFADFFENDAYGKDLEVLCITIKKKGDALRHTWLHRVTRENYSLPQGIVGDLIDQSPAVVTFIPLGKVKRAALKLPE